jgi:drug/metabolite transporter (DMT)-like permease
VAGTQLVAFLSWAVYFLLARQRFTPPSATWLAIPASAVLVFGMASLLARASARGDISVVGPVYALSPIFTVLPDALLSGTRPSPLGWLGLLLAVAGTANLSGGAPGQGRLLTLFRRRDALDALGAAVLLGGLASIDRWGALEIGPASYLLCSHGAAALLTTIILLLASRRRRVASLSRQSLLTIGIHGLLGVTGTAMQTTALMSAPAAYVNAIRRLSAVVAVLLGSTLFREPDLGRRLAAALLACAGAACLLLAR